MAPAVSVAREKRLSLHTTPFRRQVAFPYRTVGTTGSDSALPIVSRSLERSMATYLYSQPRVYPPSDCERQWHATKHFDERDPPCDLRIDCFAALRNRHLLAVALLEIALYALAIADLRALKLVHALPPIGNTSLEPPRAQIDCSPQTQSPTRIPSIYLWRQHTNIYHPQVVESIPTAIGNSNRDLIAS